MEIKAPTINFFSTTLNGAINDSVTTITLNSVTGLQAPGFLVLDREDGNGVATSASREVVYFGTITGSTITDVTRAADGSTARSHSDGALVESNMTVGVWNSLTSNILTNTATVSTLNIASTLAVTGITTASEAVDITVADEGNNVGLTVTQSDVTNNPIAATITNAGTGTGLYINQDGTGKALDIDYDINSAGTYPALNIATANAGAGTCFAMRFSGDSVISAAVGSTNNKKIKIQIDSTTYYIPCYTT